MAKQKVLPTELDGLLTVRVNSERLEAVKTKSLKEGRPHSYLMREIMDAYLENRLTITKLK